jgi:signal transduction histidine kinase
MIDLEKLRRDLEHTEVFTGLADDQLAWLGEHFVEREMEAGEVTMHEGTPADRMVVLIEGEIKARRERGVSDGRTFTIMAGEVSGMLPFSRMVTFGVTGRAVVKSRYYSIASSLFGEMLQRIPQLEPRLVGALTDRVRETARADQQREKLTALGKLSAGLAHELNNPAAAVQRSASELRDRLVRLRSLAARLIECGLTPGAMQAAVDLYKRAIERRREGIELDPLERSEHEDAVADWLAAHDVDEPWVLAGTLADFGVAPRDLDGLAAVAPGDFLGCLLTWMEGGLAAEGLLSEIASAARRISELVAAVKSYSHMDDGQGLAEVDLRRELESTLTILAHKIRKKNVQVSRDFERDLPPLVAYPGELNQVWTNLLDNALDAVPEGGHIEVRAAREGDSVRVDIRDDGPGIPEDIQPRIWEPFFTTKPVGEGTGLGLEIAQRIVVRRHSGTVALTSRPGDTCFTVRVPLRPPGSAAPAAAPVPPVPPVPPMTAVAPS